MKKLLVVLVVALLALALVACGSSGSTTAKKTNDTTPATGSDTTPATGSDTTPATGSDMTPTTGSDTTPATGSDTTPATGSDTTPDTTPLTPTEGIDILFGDLEDMVVDPGWNWCGFTFENHHPEHDYRNVFVVKLSGGANGVLDSLVLVEDLEAGTSSPYEMNQDYQWVVIIDGERIEIDTFSYRNHTTWGYVRCDLGDWTFNTEDVEADGTHGYDVRLEIYEAATGKLAYWAWFTDPMWNGLYYFAPLATIDMIADENRNPDHVRVPANDAIPLDGPIGNTNELYNNLFDGKVTTKLCTPKNEVPGSTIMWKYDTSVHVVSYSLVGANDDKSYAARLPYSFVLYGSNDDKNWTVIDEQNLAPYTAAESYAERNFKLDTACDYTYFKLEIKNAEQYQLSEIILYTEEEYLGG